MRKESVSARPAEPLGAFWHSGDSSLRPLQQLFDQAPGFVAVLMGADHVFEFVNDAFRRFVHQREVLGKPVHLALPETVGQGFVALLDRTYETGETFVGHRMPVSLAQAGDATADIITATATGIGAEGPAVDQRYIDFVYQPMRNDDGDVIGIFIEGSDVTEQEQLSRELRESEARFRAITNAMPQIVWSARPDGHHDYFNERYYEYTGLPAGAADGLGWMALYPPEDQERIRIFWNHALRTGEPYEIEYRLRHRSGQYRWVLGRALPVTDADGRITRWMGTCTDIHDQVLARELLREDARRKDEFLAVLSHELRNPLAPMRTSAALLETAGEDADARHEIAGIIGRQVAHMTHLIDDLLDVSRVTRGVIRLELTDADLTELVGLALEQIRPLIDARHHQVHVRSPAQPVPVRVDRTRMVQVIGNLLHNAARFTPEGGRIDIALETLDREAVLSVKDNGSGIDPALLPRVFDLFEQGTPGPGVVSGGLGIGLALARSITVLHGGRIRAVSDGPGRGSCFDVRLPLASTSTPGPAEHTAPHPRTTTSHVVVVDDNVDAARTTAWLLEYAGNRVSVFHDGASTLAAADPGEVYLIDIGLPDMSGLELARRLRGDERTAGVALIALTGYGSDDDEQRSRDAGFDAHLVKPLDVARLHEVINEVTSGN